MTGIMGTHKQQQDDIIIDYTPVGERGKPQWLTLLAFAFVLTWGLMVGGAIYVNQQLENRESYSLSQQDNPTLKTLDTLKQNEQKLSQTIQENRLLAARVKELESLISALPDTLPSDESHRETFADFSKRLEKLEQQTSAENLPQLDSALSPLILALLNLRERIDNNMPHEAELTLVQKLGSGDSILRRDLETLKTLLTQEVAGPNVLYYDFQNLVEQYREQPPERDSSGFWGQFSSAVKIRKIIPEKEDKSPEATMQRIERYLKYSQIDEALLEFKQLPEAQRNALNSWKEKAERWIKTETLFAQMYERVTRLSSKLHAKHDTPATPKKATKSKSYATPVSIYM